MSESSPNDLLSLRHQEEEAYKAKDWAGLCAALTGQALLASGGEEKSGLFFRAGAAAVAGHDLERAADLLSQAVDPPWAVPSCLFRLEIFWKAMDWARVIEILDESARRGVAWETEVLELEKARILAFRLGRVDEAMAILSGLAGGEKGSREALWMMAALSLRAGTWDKVAAHYKSLLDHADLEQDFDFVRTAAFRLGQIHEARFKKPEQAAEWYAKVSGEQAPLLSMFSLFELAEAGRDWKKASDLGGVIRKTVEDAGNQSPSYFRMFLALAKESFLKDKDGAYADFKEMADADPDDFDALYAACERSMERDSSVDRAELESRLAARLSDPKEASYFQDDRIRLLVEDLADYEPAIADARQGMERFPEDATSPRWLIEALRRAGRHQETVGEIDRLLAKTQDQKVRQALLFTKAELATHKLDDQNAALAAYQEALQIPPSQLPILVSMVRIYHVKRDYNNLARFIAAIVKMVQDPAVKKHYQAWLANLYLERLSLDDQAFALFGEIVKADPGDRTAMKTIVRISRKKESWNNVAGALSRMIGDTADPALQAQFKLQLAWIHETRMNQPGKAKPIYQELGGAGNLFATDSSRRIAYAEANTAEYLAALSALAEQSPDPLKSAQLVRVALAREIQGELTESWAAYEKARVSMTREPHLLLPMIDLSQLAGYWGRYLSLVEELAGRLGDRNKRALLWESAWGRAEMAGPSGQVDVEAMARSFQSLAESSGDWQAALRGSLLASVWTGDHKAHADALARLMKVTGEEASPPIRLRLAYALRDDLGAGEESIAALRQVLAKHQKSAPLLRELALMYEEAGQWGELIRMMLLEIPLRKEPPVLIEMYDRLAKIYEDHFKALDEAIKCHQTALKIDPRRVASHEERARLLEARGRFEDLVKALAEFETITADPAGKISILVRQATVLDEKLKDVNQAIGLLKKALDLDPSRSDLLSALEKIYEREQRFPELVEILLAQVERVDDNAVKSVLHERVAGIQETQLKNPAAAIDNLVKARDLDPGRQSALLSLERLFTQAERWEELIDTLERLAKAGDDKAKIGYYSRIGVLWDEKLGKIDDSISSWERVRPLDVRNEPALSALVSLYERKKDYPNFVLRSAELAETVKDDKTRAVSVLIRAGQVLETEIKDDDRAIEFYNQARAIDPSALDPLRAARSIHERRENWPEAAKLWLAEEQLTESVDQKLEIITRVGGIYEHKIGDEKSATGSYERALSLRGDYLPAAEPLSEIYYKRESYDKARPLFELRAERLEGKEPALAAEIWYKSGWSAEKTGKVEAAMQRYHSSEKAVPQYRPPLERLSELYAEQQKWDPASDITARLLEVLRSAKDTAAAFTVLHRKGLIEDKRNKLDLAILAFEEAQTLKPGDYPTLTKLINLYERTEQWKKALTTYDLAIKNAPSKQAAADGLVGKGKVLEDHVKEEGSALAHFQAAVKHVPDHLEGWNRLAAIYLRRKMWPEAEGALKNLLRLEKDTSRLVEHHYNLGRVYADGMNDLESARDQFAGALKLDENHIPSTKSLLDIYLKLEEWTKFIDTGEKFVRKIPESGQKELIPVYVDMGRVYRDHADNNERAVIHFQTAIRLNPENKEARSELAALYLSDPKFIEQAKQENRNLIHMEPFRPQTYKDLFSIYKSNNQLDPVFFISSILKHMDALDYEEEMFYEANVERAKNKSSRTLKQLEREGHLLHADEKGPLHDLLVAIADQLTKMYPLTPEKMGVKKAYMLSAESKSAVKDLAAEFAVNLGLEDLDIYQVPQDEAPYIIPTSPPSLVINTDWMNRFSEKEQRFIMGRLIEHALDAHAFVIHFPPEKILQTLCVLAQTVNSSLSFEIPGVSNAELEKQKKNVKKLIPTFGAKNMKMAIEHAAERFTLETAQIDPATWKRAMLHTDNRAGLLMCGDLFTAMDVIVKTNPDYKDKKYDTFENKKEVWQNSPEIIEMLDYAMSDSFYRLRDRLGFSIT